MNLALDIDGTITDFPEFYIELLKCWKGDIYIVTGRRTKSAKETFKTLTDLGIDLSKIKEFLFYPVDYDQVTEQVINDIAQWKAQEMIKRNIELFFDDSWQYIDVARKMGIKTFNVKQDLYR